jgi:hypothetical protein
MRQGRARGENGEKAVRKEVIVWTGIVMVCCSLLFIIIPSLSCGKPFVISDGGGIASQSLKGMKISYVVEYQDSQ